VCLVSDGRYSSRDERSLVQLWLSATHPRGDSVTVYYEGWTNDEDEQKGLYKLKMGQIEHGMSGAPLLNVRTGGVCGVMRLRRTDRNDPAVDLGGRAIPIDTVLAVFPKLEEKQSQFHQQDRRWVNLLKKRIASESIEPPASSQFKNKATLNQGVQGIFNAPVNIFNMA
jgi:hypothetical protein